MINNVLVDRVLTKYQELTANHLNEHDAMRHALESVEGAFEQRFENDQVRRGKEQGSCPCCGADWR